MHTHVAVQEFMDFERSPERAAHLPGDQGMPAALQEPGCAGDPVSLRAGTA